MGMRRDWEGQDGDETGLGWAGWDETGLGGVGWG